MLFLGNKNIILFPWLVEVYIIRLYAAVINLTKAKYNIKYIVEDIIEIIIIISLIRLIEGGAPILMALIKNHHIVIDGVKAIIPLFKYILRELDISVTIFA